jgi:ribose transport system substrate-binding protein
MTRARHTRVVVSRATTASKAVALFGAAALLAVGCGTAGNSGSTASGGSAAGSADAPAELKTQVESWLKRPTDISITQPIGKPVPQGKNIFFISCGGLACNLAGEEMQQGAAKLGWTVKTLSAKTPQEFKAAVDTAIQQHADGLVWWTSAGDAVKPELDTLKAERIPAVTVATYEATDAGQPSPIGKPNPGITATIYPATEIIATVQKFADLAVYYGGQKAKILEITPAGYDLTEPQRIAVENEVKKWCPGCTVDTENIPYSAVGKTSAQTLTDLIRTHKPDVVVTGTDDFLLGVPQAVRAAGLKLPILIASAPTESGLQGIAAGDIRAEFAFPIKEYAWATVDALARYYTGESLQPSIAPMPSFVITKDNLPGTKLFPNDPAYEQKFAHLWGVGA